MGSARRMPRRRLIGWWAQIGEGRGWNQGLKELCEFTLVSLGKLPSATGESPVPPIAQRPSNHAPAPECFGWYGQLARSAGQLAQWKRKAPRSEGHRNLSA